MVASRTKAAKLPIQESSGRGVKRSAESTAGQLSLHSFLRPSSSATNVQESVRTARGGPTEPEPAGSARPSTPSLGSGNAVTFAAAAASDPKDAQEESSSPFTSLLGEKSSSSFTNSSEAKSPGPSTNLAARSSLSSTATTTSPGPAPMSPVPAAGLGRSATATATATTTATAMATTSRGNPSRGGGRLSLGELYQKNVSSAAGPSSARSSRGKGLFGQEVQSALAALRVADSIPEEPSEGSRGVPESLRRASEEGGEEAKLRNSEGGGGGGGGNAESGEPEHEKKKNTSSGAEGAGSREQVEQTKTSGPKTNPLQAASPLRSTRRRLSTKGPPQARCATPKGTPRSRKRATATTTTTTTTTTTATTTSSSRAASKKAQKQGENAEESHAQAQQGGADVEESASDPCAKTSDEPLNAATATPNTTTATAATATATATARAAESAEAKSAVNDSVTQGSEKRKQSRRALGAPAPSKRSRKKPLPTEAQAEENKENETDNSSNKIKGSDTHNNNSSNNNSNKINLTDGNGNDPSKRKLQDCKITEDNPKPSTADVAEFGNDNGGNTDSLEDAQTPRPPPRKHAKETKPSRPAASEEKKGPPTIEPTLNSAEPEREEPQSKESLGSASSGRLTLRERLARRTSIPGGSRPSEAAQEEGQNSTEADTDASSGQDHKKLGGLTLQWRLMFEGNRHPSRSELGADEPSKPKEAKPAPVSPLMPRAFNSTPTTSRSKSPTKTEDVASARGALADRGTSPTVRTPPSHESFQGGPSKADSRRASRGSPTTDETTSFYPDMTHATSSELKAALLARGVGLAGCVEKADLLALWRKMIESPSKEKDPEPFLSRGRLSSSDLSSSVGNRRRVSVSGAPPDHGTTSPFLCHAQTSTFSSNSNSSNNNNSSKSSSNSSIAPLLPNEDWLVQNSPVSGAQKGEVRIDEDSNHNNNNDNKNDDNNNSKNDSSNNNNLNNNNSSHIDQSESERDKNWSLRFLCFCLVLSLQLHML